MKKLVALLLTLSLALCASAALADTFTYENYFSIEFPEGWTLQQDDSSNTDTNWYCGFFPGPGDTDLNFSVRMYYEEDLADFRLFDYQPEDSQFQEYAQLVTEWFASKNLAFAGTAYSNADNLPFAVFQGSDDYGPLAVADTMSNGWEFYFEFYAFADSNYDTCRELTDDDMTMILQILGSFVPAE